MLFEQIKEEFSKPKKIEAKIDSLFQILYLTRMATVGRWCRFACRSMWLCFIPVIHINGTQQAWAIHRFLNNSTNENPTSKTSHFSSYLFEIQFLTLSIDDSLRSVSHSWANKFNSSCDCWSNDNDWMPIESASFESSSSDSFSVPVGVGGGGGDDKGNWDALFETRPYGVRRWEL